MDDKIADLLNKQLIVINVGVQNFADSLSKQGVDVIHIDWSPPAGGDEQMMGLLDTFL
jgi:FdrA protein